MTRFVLISALAVFLILLPELSFSQDTATVSEKLCEFRQMLCGGGAGIGIVMIVIVGISLMIFIGKINWTFVFIMAGCMIFYFSADQITTMLFEDEVDCPCNE